MSLLVTRNLNLQAFVALTTVYLMQKSSFLDFTMPFSGTFYQQSFYNCVSHICARSPFFLLLVHFIIENPPLLRAVMVGSGVYMLQTSCYQIFEPLLYLVCYRYVTVCLFWLINFLNSWSCLMYFDATVYFDWYFLYKKNQLITSNVLCVGAVDDLFGRLGFFR